MDELNPAEKSTKSFLNFFFLIRAFIQESLEGIISAHSDEDRFTTKIPIVVDPKKRKLEERLIVIGKHRVYLFKLPGGKVTHLKSIFVSFVIFRAKLDFSFHLLEIVEVSSQGPTLVNLKIILRFLS